ASHLVNTGLQQQFFWDSRTRSLEDQVTMPIENHLEMGINDFSSLTTKLSEFDYYGPLFTEAFGSEEINKERISIALSSFLRSMISHESKWDQVSAGTATFTSLEERGQELFNESGCVNCHGGPNFDGWGSSTAVIGLDNEPIDIGAGSWMGETGNGSFKIPSLRNVALTAPYMHDGRFSNLSEVVAHYNDGIKDVPNLDWRLTDGEFNTTFLENDFLIDIDLTALGGDPIQLNLSSTDQQALIAFLKTLTDEKFVKNPKFQDPF
ncbi:MAG: cytochrome-c peroxidase, partial [Flavobacteriales bacterium]